MFRVIAKLALSIILIIGVIFIIRFISDYLSGIILTDYLAYSGIALLVIAGVSIDKEDTANRDIMTLITQRELVTRDVHTDNEVNRISLSLSFGLSGSLCLVASGLLAWLS